MEKAALEHFDKNNNWNKTVKKTTTMKNSTHTIEHKKNHIWIFHNKHKNRSIPPKKKYEDEK